MESTLAIDKFRLEAEIGDSAGFGVGERYGDTAWDASQLRQIERALHSGLRMVYFTSEIRDQAGKIVVPGSYDWTWFQPTSTVILPEDEITIPAPSDFGGLNGRVIPASTDGSIQFPVAVVGREELYGARATGSTATGRPTMLYVEAIKGVQPGRSNRYQFQIWPTPDEEYQLQVWYYTIPDAPTEMLPYVYGGAPHAETFKSAVRAAYERYCLNRDGGPEWSMFERELAKSVAYDRKFKPVTLGPNIDRSDYGWDWNPHLRRDHVPVFVNGVEASIP
jgi:hypothetical protein